MKNILLIIGGVVLIGGVAVVFCGTPFTGSGSEEATKMNMAENDAAVVQPGTYTVDPARSEFNWAGNKPLIEGYVNSGTIAIAEGTITVGETQAGGVFTLDMNTLHVGLTARKPGKEGALEEHLKSDRWFDVATYPTARFAITDVAPTADSETTFKYRVTGDLTLKGITHPISFIAHIYQTADGTVYAEAETEIDRTQWGLTSGSGTFFDNLGDNLIADNVALSFSIAATRTP